MNLLIFAARAAQLLAKAQIDQAGLESMERDVKRQVYVKAKVCYLVYDDQDGITFFVVLDVPERSN